MSGNGNCKEFNISGLDSGCLNDTFHEYGTKFPCFKRILWGLKWHFCGVITTRYVR